MTTRTALEIALDLDAASCSSFAKLEAAEALRKQHDEIERLKADADRVNSCAKNLAIAMHRKNFSNITQWEPLPDTMGLISQIDNMSCWHDAEIDSLKRERHHIYDLLARIHRDGGQYTSDHGVEKACEDAESQVVAWLETINGIDALIEQARIAERAACAATAPDLLWALETIIDASPEPPEANCSCHICPPCRDCVDYEELREAYRYVRAAIAKAA